MKKKYLLLLIIGFIFYGCSETMTWKNYATVYGIHNSILPENKDIDFDIRFESVLEKKNFFGSIYGNTYNYEINITIKNMSIYDNIEKIKFNKLMLLYKETELDLLKLPDIIIRYPSPGCNNESAVNSFKENNVIPLIISSEEADSYNRMTIALYFNNIQIDFNEIDKLTVKFNFEIIDKNGDVIGDDVTLLYKREINKYKIPKFTT